MAKKKQQQTPDHRRKWIFGIFLVGCLIAVLAGVAWWVIYSQAASPKEAPEAQKVLDLQAGMPFQILIPAYLPKQFQREKMEIDTSQTGPGGEPMVHIVYRTKKGQTLFIQEWVPVNPEMETLSAAHPIQTKWGDGWLLRQGLDLAVIWVDIGPLRTSIYTRDLDLLPVENLLAVAENMGPASNRQVFSFIVEPPEVLAVPPAPPVEATLNAEGIQEVDLIITPGGYSPLRFSVKKDIPVHLTFRALGEVGCGNELILPISSTETASLLLESETDEKTLDFTPADPGEYHFYCGHAMYRGVMIVNAGE